MTKYRKHNWQEYFKAFEQSDLTQTAFCKLHEINPKYFSQKLAQHKAGNTAFTKAIIETQEAITTGLILEVGNCKVHCPVSMSIPSFITLVKPL